MGPWVPLVSVAWSQAGSHSCILLRFHPVFLTGLLQVGVCILKPKNPNKVGAFCFTLGSRIPDRLSILGEGEWVGALRKMKSMVTVKKLREKNDKETSARSRWASTWGWKPWIYSSVVPCGCGVFSGTPHVETKQLAGWTAAGFSWGGGWACGQGPAAPAMASSLRRVAGDGGCSDGEKWQLSEGLLKWEMRGGK